MKSSFSVLLICFSILLLVSMMMPVDAGPSNVKPKNNDGSRDNGGGDINLQSPSDADSYKLRYRIPADPVFVPQGDAILYIAELLTIDEIAKKAQISDEIILSQLTNRVFGISLFSLQKFPCIISYCFTPIPVEEFDPPVNVHLFTCYALGLNYDADKKNITAIRREFASTVNTYPCQQRTDTIAWRDYTCKVRSVDEPLPCIPNARNSIGKATIDLDMACKVAGYQEHKGYPKFTGYMKCNDEESAKWKNGAWYIKGRGGDCGWTDEITCTTTCFNYTQAAKFLGGDTSYFDWNANEGQIDAAIDAINSKYTDTHLNENANPILYYFVEPILQSIPDGYVFLEKVDLGSSQSMYFYGKPRPEEQPAATG